MSPLDYITDSKRTSPVPTTGHYVSARHTMKWYKPPIAARTGSSLGEVKMALCIKRREFVSLLGGATVAWPFVAFAQKPDRMRRIGVLMSLDENDIEGKAQLSGFTQGLADLGWSNGSNLRIEVRWGGGDVIRIRTFAKELVALQPYLILAQGTPVTAALQRETRTIPIVFVVVTDPVGDRFVAGLPHPGGNITGFLTSEAGITAKMLELLREIAPGLKRVAILFNPDTAPGEGAYY